MMTLVFMQSISSWAFAEVKLLLAIIKLPPM